MKNIIVFYHKNCLDGFGAAWAAWKKFRKRADYIGITPGSKPPPYYKNIKNKEIYFIDVGYGKKEMLELEKNNRKLVFIDHHISRSDISFVLMNAIFDLNRSGAVLSWQYFHPKNKIPKLLAYVEDYDLWKFKLLNTKEINAAIGLKDWDFEQWDKMAADLENQKKKGGYIKEGSAILKYINKVVPEILEISQKVIFENYKAAAVNSPILASEIGNYMVKKMNVPIGIVWSYEGDMLRVQLRSNKSVDVSKIAKKFGGGGHKQAAGFKLKSDITFPWKNIR